MVESFSSIVNGGIFLSSVWVIFLMFMLSLLTAAGISGCVSATESRRMAIFWSVIVL